jgi:hypothetical protein
LWNRKIDRDLSTICLKCLEKDPKPHYSSALALVEDLEHRLKHEPIHARLTEIFTRGREWARRNPNTFFASRHPSPEHSLMANGSGCRFRIHRGATRASEKSLLLWLRNKFHFELHG